MLSRLVITFLPRSKHLLIPPINDIIFVLFCLIYFTQYDHLMAHLCCWKWHFLFFFFFVSFYVYVYGPSQIKFLWIVQSSGWNLLLQFCFHVDIQLFQQKFLKCFPIEFPRNLYQNSINGMYVCLCLYLFDFMDLLLFIYTNQSVLINVPL